MFICGSIFYARNFNLGVSSYVWDSGDITLSATATSRLAVSFESSDEDVAVVEGGKLVVKRAGVTMLNGVEYRSFSDKGLEIAIDGQVQYLDVDNVVVCAGQLSNNVLAEELTALGQSVEIIGGAFVAAELDAKRAIRQGAELAAKI